MRDEGIPGKGFSNQECPNRLGGCYEFIVAFFCSKDFSP